MGSITLGAQELIACVALASLVVGSIVFAAVAEIEKMFKESKEQEKETALLTQLQLEELALRTAAFNARKSMVHDAVQARQNAQTGTSAESTTTPPDSNPDGFWESDAWK